MAAEQFPTINAMCQGMPRPLLVQGFILSWLQDHFSAAANVEEPDLADCVWDPDETKSGILIESVTRWKPSTTEQRPAVMVKRGAWRATRLGIDDRFMGHTPAGDRGYAKLMEGTHAVFCVSNQPAECELLATEVFRELTEFGPLIRPMARLHRFAVTDMGELAILEEARQNYVIPIGVAYAAEESWQITHQRPPLKTVRMSAFQA